MYLFTEDGKKYYSTGETIDSEEYLSGEAIYSVIHSIGEQTFICFVEE